MHYPMHYPAHSLAEQVVQSPRMTQPTLTSTGDHPLNVEALYPRLVAQLLVGLNHCMPLSGVVASCSPCAPPKPCWAAASGPPEQRRVRRQSRVRQQLCPIQAQPTAWHALEQQDISSSHFQEVGAATNNSNLGPTEPAIHSPPQPTLSQGGHLIKGGGEALQDAGCAGCTSTV